ncbi:hypothetical protein BDQ17DRAFT_1339359 [Cyathus striatus]|nr:hypothetical protein BDQ17DRAFT_1339359 [Cyathus striatus]
MSTDEDYNSKQLMYSFTRVLGEKQYGHYARKRTITLAVLDNKGTGRIGTILTDEDSVQLQAIIVLINKGHLLSIRYQGKNFEFRQVPTDNSYNWYNVYKPLCFHGKWDSRKKKSLADGGLYILQTTTLIPALKGENSKSCFDPRSPTVRKGSSFRTWGQNSQQQHNSDGRSTNPASQGASWVVWYMVKRHGISGYAVWTVSREMLWEQNFQTSNPDGSANLIFPVTGKTPQQGVRPP